MINLINIINQTEFTKVSELKDILIQNKIIINESDYLNFRNVVYLCDKYEMTNDYFHNKLFYDLVENIYEEK